MIHHRLHRFLKQITQIILLVTSYGLLVTDVFARPVSSAELIENARQYDGQTISFQGEAVGDIMKRGDFAWVNVHDGQNALGIWVRYVLTLPVTLTGAYKSSGDIIEVKGIFHRACPEHGGDLDIHADSLTVIRPGQKINETFNEGKKRLIIGLMGVVVCLLILRVWRGR